MLNTRFIFRAFPYLVLLTLLTACNVNSNSSKEALATEAIINELLWVGFILINPGLLMMPCAIALIPGQWNHRFTGISLFKLLLSGNALFWIHINYFCNTLRERERERERKKESCWHFMPDRLSLVLEAVLIY